MRPALLLAVALGLVLPLAGCAEDPDEADTQSDPSTTTSATRSPRATGSSTATATGVGGGNATGNQTGNGTASPPGNATGDPSGNATGNATGNVTWTYDNRTGRVSGTAIPVLAPSFSKTEAFNVTNGTQRLVLNLTVTGSQVTMTVSPPGCTTSACANTTKTAGGTAQLTYENATAGGWSVKLSVSATVGSVQADYKLVIAKLAVPANATAS